MNDFEALIAANMEFERRLRLVTCDDWHRPTPCTEWDVHALVNHVVGGSRRHMMLLRGATPAEADATRTEDHLGEDAVTAFLAGARTLMAELQTAGALDRQVHHPTGDRNGRELLGMRILDVTVHTWDLACAIDADRELNRTLVQHTLLNVTGRQASAPEVPLHDGATSDISVTGGLTNQSGRSGARARPNGSMAGGAAVDYIA